MLFEKVKLSEGLRFNSLILATVLLCSCASAPSSEYNQGSYYDPFEKTNRAIFNFNDKLDQAVVKPVAETYDTFMPAPAKKGIKNFLRNLGAPIDAANQLLQGDIEGFAGSTMRFAVNSTFGLLGLIDVASDAGIKYESEDFGQTLAVWGVGEGPYIVLPLLGPGALRDQFGNAVDNVADPVRLYAYNKDEEMFHYGRMAAAGIDLRSSLLSPLADIRDNSLDYYAAFKSIQYQNRIAEINDNQVNEKSVVEIPDYDDDYDFIDE